MPAKKSDGKDEKKEDKRPRFHVGDLIKPKFKASQLNDTETAKVAGLNKEMTNFILKVLDDSKPVLVIYSSTKKSKDKSEVNIVRLDKDFQHVWISDDFEKVGESEKKDRRDSRLNDLSSEHHIHLARPEVVHELTKAFMAQIEKVMRDFEGICSMEVIEACSTVQTFTATKEVARALSNGSEGVGGLLEGLMRSSGEDGDYVPSKDKTKTDHYIT